MTCHINFSKSFEARLPNQKLILKAAKFSVFSTCKFESIEHLATLNIDFKT